MKPISYKPISTLQVIDIKPEILDVIIQHY